MTFSPAHVSSSALTLTPHEPKTGLKLFRQIFFFNLFILFISFWLCWVFVASRGLSLVAASGGYSSLWCAGSRHVGFSSCSTQAQ